MNIFHTMNSLIIRSFYSERLQTPRQLQQHIRRWIAWLSKKPNKIVVTPKKWLLDEEMDKKYVKQLIPESWIKY